MDIHLQAVLSKRIEVAVPPHCCNTLLTPLNPLVNDIIWGIYCQTSPFCNRHHPFHCPMEHEAGSIEKDRFVQMCVGILKFAEVLQKYGEMNDNSKYAMCWFTTCWRENLQKTMDTIFLNRNPTQ